MFLMFFTSCKTLKLTAEYLDNTPSVVPKSGKMVNLYNALIYAAKKEYK